jgi:hypothetical protein
MNLFEELFTPSNKGYFQALEPMETQQQLNQPNSPVQPISLTDPSNIFQMDNLISDRLNQFQIRYARYLQCQDPLSAASVSNPPCDTITLDSFDSVSGAYISLSSAIQDVSNSFANQTYIGAKTPAEYNADYEKLMKEYTQIVELRRQLDNDLLELEKEKNGGPDTPLARFESAAYINTLWIILATFLIYIIFVGF